MAAITYPEFIKTLRDPFRKGIIMTILTGRRFMQYIPFKTIPGLAYAYNTTKSLPAVSWRKLNEEWTATAGVVQRSVEPLKILGGESNTDIELVKAYGESERIGRDKMYADAVTKTFLQYMLYGNCGARVVDSPYEDIDGMDGIVTRLTSGQTVNATGTSATVGSSVFVFKFGDPYCLGLQSHPFEAENMGRVKNNYVSAMGWTPGIAIMHGMSVSRVKNIDTTAVFTADMLDEAIDKIDGDPTVILMSKRSRRQLKADAAAKAGLGITLDEFSKPITSWYGTPIVADEIVVDTEDNTA